MPSFFSGAPKLSPSSPCSTINALTPLLPAAGSVTAITVYKSDAPALLIQRFTPFSTQCPPSRTALAFIDSASDPASGSERQYENDRPAANCVKYFDLSSSSPLSMRGNDP